MRVINVRQRVREAKLSRRRRQIGVVGWPFVLILSTIVALNFANYADILVFLFARPLLGSARLLCKHFNCTLNCWRKLTREILSNPLFASLFIDRRLKCEYDSSARATEVSDKYLRNATAPITLLDESAFREWSNVLSCYIAAVSLFLFDTSTLWTTFIIDCRDKRR